MLDHRSRDPPAINDGVTYEPNNEFVFNGNADFPRLSFL
jgi:hypothetical protein